MAEQVVLSNDKITVTVSSRGAELISVKKDGKEKIWIGDPDVWKFHAPVLFPICGGLKADKYVYEGREYNLQKHGYARVTEFEVESKSKDKAVFLHRFNAETLKQFPFEYELRVIYSINDSELNVAYNVKNLSKDKMYFSVGAHEGYYCPEGIEEYSIIFEKSEMLESSILNGNLLEYKTVNVGQNTCELPLKYEYFTIDALVFLNLKSKKLSLKNRKTGEAIFLEYEGHDFLLLWTKPDAKYICIEPWCGCPDFVDSDGYLKNKKGIIELSGDAEITKSHKIIFD
ncbi:MAG: aldose 1-epimerase family protein [Firmicutes bacterium]|nr:aldose 1-epimerase family protein [Bacillota bacterium]